VTEIMGKYNPVSPGGAEGKALSGLWIQCSKWCKILLPMAAAYDTFDYPSYWIGREYEHRSEVIALKAFLSKIKRIKTILEIGAGFGRLAPIYSYRAKRVILSDPSSKTLKVARNAFKDKKNFRFIHSSLENIPNKLRASSLI